MPSSIRSRIDSLRAELEIELQKADRPSGAVRMCAVSKRHPLAMIHEALEAGIEDIAESYVQEAVAKITGLSGPKKHFIGHLQTNKAKAIVGLFDVIHSVDRLEAGVAIAKAVQTLGRGVQVLIQVNVSPTDRFGALPHEAVKLAQELRKLGLDVDGVMAIGPLTGDPNALKTSFEQAHRSFLDIGGSTFSIGMSGDWREAVAFGSTMIRVGTAIFGPRDQPTTER